MIRHHCSRGWKCVLNLQSVFLHCQLRGATTNHISVLASAYTSDNGACRHRYSLCAAWVCHWKHGYSYVFSRWISRWILPFHGDRLNSCRSHYTHRLQQCRAASYPPPLPPNIGAPLLAIGTPRSPSLLLSLDWLFDMWFSAPYFLFCLRSRSGMGAPQSQLLVLSLDWGFDISFRTVCCRFCPRSSCETGAPQTHPQSREGASLFNLSHFASVLVWCCPGWKRCSTGYALLNSHRHSSGWICTPQCHSALPYDHQHSSCPPRTTCQELLLSCWPTSFSPELIKLRFKIHFDSLQANLNCSLLDIPNLAKWH